MKRTISERGFTLIEILLVVAIIGIITAAAIPNLHRARMTANEANAIGGLKTICAAQHDYNNNSSPHSYAGELACLGSGDGAGNIPFIEPILASGLKNGYIYTLITGDPNPRGDIWSWSVSAWPVVYRSTGVRSFYIDSAGLIRGTDLGGIPVDRSAPTLE